MVLPAIFTAAACYTSYLKRGDGRRLQLLLRTLRNDYCCRLKDRRVEFNMYLNRSSHRGGKIFHDIRDDTRRKTFV